MQNIENKVIIITGASSGIGVLSATQNTKNKLPKMRKSAAVLLNKWYYKAKYLS